MGDNLRHPGATGDGRNWRGPRNLLLLALVVVIAGATYALWWFAVGQYWVSVDDAYVQGNKYPITAQVGGQVDQVFAYDTQAVKAGQVLVRLRAQRLAADLQAAEAEVIRQKDDASALLAEIQEAQAKAQALAASLAAAQARSVRLSTAADSGAAAGLDAIIAQHQVQERQHQWQAAQAHILVLRKRLGNHGLAGYPPLREAEAKLTIARINWTRRNICAPVAGVLAQEAVQPGQHVSSGQRLFTVVPLNQIWVDAYVKETRLRGIQPGAAAQLRAELYGRQVRYRGWVVGIGAATGAEFAVLPPENASGNWIQFTQRVPVRILIDPNDLKAHPLRPGLTMHVDIHRYGSLHYQQPPLWFTHRRVESGPAELSR